MKTIKNVSFLSLFFLICISFSAALEIEEIGSYEIVERLLGFSQPMAPQVFEDFIIFTASSSFRRAGVAVKEFSSANNNNFKVNWLRQLLVLKDSKELIFEANNPEKYKDSGISFYIYKIPEGVSSVEYRLIINGLWTTDPLNPNVSIDKSGISWSVVSFPTREIKPDPLKGPVGSLCFNFKGPPGETVTVAGSFNNWDPFMYELKENTPGHYSINIPLPPGRYQYVFFNKGQRWLDPYNFDRVYTKDGSAASEILIE